VHQGRARTAPDRLAPLLTTAGSLPSGLAPVPAGRPSTGQVGDQVKAKSPRSLFAYELPERKNPHQAVLMSGGDMERDQFVAVETESWWLLERDVDYRIEDLRRDLGASFGWTDPGWYLQRERLEEVYTFILTQPREVLDQLDQAIDDERRQRWLHTVIQLNTPVVPSTAPSLPSPPPAATATTPGPRRAPSDPGPKPPPPAPAPKPRPTLMLRPSRARRRLMSVVILVCPASVAGSAPLRAGSRAQAYHPGMDEASQRRQDVPGRTSRFRVGPWTLVGLLLFAFGLAALAGGHLIAHPIAVDLA
jgi:hypothetical protein